MTQLLAQLDTVEKSLASVSTIEEARRLLVMADSYTSAAAKVHWAVNKIADCNVDKEHAHNVACRAGEIKLFVEARLGELIQQEQASGNLAKQGQPKKGDTVVTLNQVGLTKKDSQRAQLVADNRSLIAEVVAEAKANGDIPTRQALERLTKRREQEKQREAILLKQVTWQNNKKVTLLYGEFQKQAVTIPDNSVSAIITDPPYGAAFLPEWEQISALARRVLVPGGYLISYSGNQYLPSVLTGLSTHLNYFWMCALPLSNRNLVNTHSIYNLWKPIIIYYKEPLATPSKYFVDLIDNTGREKDYHPWQQSEEELTKFIEAFVPKDGLILDPVCGSGTTLLAALKNNRRCIGIEKDQEYFEVAKRRLM
jgi:16S rRNA G966 N2-methylase RsmD